MSRAGPQSETSNGTLGKWTIAHKAAVSWWFNSDPLLCGRSCLHHAIYAPQRLVCARNVFFQVVFPELLARHLLLHCSVTQLHPLNSVE